MTILITGSSGLIGSALTRHFIARGSSVTGADLRSSKTAECVDVSDVDCVAQLLTDITGIIHLAAVSRVIDGERDPARCWHMNVDTTRRLLQAAFDSARRPWFIYASSREVYGLQELQPVTEEAVLQPMNVYARSKVAAEIMVEEARSAGLVTSILRFANVYGSVDDHIDRVVPAFVSAAVAGGNLRVDGSDCSFDINHVDDVVRGIASAADLLDGGERSLPALHFVSGRSTTLLELATMCCDIGAPGARITEAPPRNFDVHRLTGDPQRARAILGWRTTIDLETGLARLAREFAACRA